MIIEPGRIINDFIEPNKRQYAIPVYQRNYEWSKEQCVKLFDDIIQAYYKDKTHFCGSVVYALLKEEHNIYYYIIIDGQQRLTTIYLLLKALLDSADSEQEREMLSDSLFNKDKFDKYAIDTASKLKLKPIKSDNKQLALLMDDKKDELDKTSDIWYNYNLFHNLILSKKQEGMTVKEIYKGIEKLICAKIKLDNEDNAQEIFERINSTGIPLSLADKIRNFVLMTDINQEELYEKYWLKTEQLLGRDYMESFFLDYLNFKVTSNIKIEEAYDNFKIFYKSNNYTNEKMLSEILHYAEFYHAFLYGDKKYSVGINNELANLRKLKQTTIFLFLFRVFDDLDAEVIDEKELEKVLKLLLNYSIRRQICDISSNSLRGLYKSMYARVFAKEESKQHYYDAIVCFLKQLTSRDVFIDDDIFLTALQENNLYRKNALCKFLLAEIENQGKEKVNIEDMTIEHIMPQNNNLSTEWQAMLGLDWERVKEKYLHTLGNLTLTAYNSELGDKPFSDKKSLLDKVSKVTILYEDVKDKDSWNEKSIVNRGNRLAKIILKLYPMVNAENIIKFTDPNYKEYTCDNPQDATYKNPNYYILQEERVVVNSFSDMLRSVIDRLFEIDPEIIKDMARNNKKLVSSSQNVMFSYDPTITTGDDYKLGNTGIYESTNFSASHSMKIIQALIDAYGIDRNDFLYSAKPYKTKNND